jgi:hypothetical protein
MVPARSRRARPDQNRRHRRRLVRPVRPGRRRRQRRARLVRQPGEAGGRRRRSWPPSWPACCSCEAGQPRHSDGTSRAPNSPRRRPSGWPC